MVVCPFCSKSLAPKRRVKILMATGVLTIISTIVVIIFGIVSINGAIQFHNGFSLRGIINGYIGGINMFFWSAGIFQFFAVAVGLAGAVFQIRRKHFFVSLFSNILLIISSLIQILQSFSILQSESGMIVIYSGFELLAIPPIVLSLLSMSLIAISKKQFRN